MRRLLTLSDQARNDGLDASLFNTGYQQLDSASDNYGSYTEAVAFEVGDRAYDAMRLSIDNGVVPNILSTGATNPGFEGLLRAVGDDFTAVNREFFFADDPSFVPSPITRSDYFRFIANTDPLAGGSWDSASGFYRSSPLFGLDSLEELLTFHRINNPDKSSRLEKAMHGRGLYAAGDDEATLGPLRSNRQRETSSFFVASGGDAAGRTDQFLSHSLMDVRGRLTTLSGYRPLRGADLPATPAFVDPQPAAWDLLDPIDLKTPIDTLLFVDALSPTNNTADTDALFQTYANSLLPWSDLPDAWVDPALAPLAYGGSTHRTYGPEFALRVAAHMAVNMTDIVDTDNTPTRRTLLVDESRRADLGGGNREPGTPYDLLDLGAPRLAQDETVLIEGGSDFGRVVNVFGIEAQPFITMAGAFTVYADVPATNGGNTEPPDTSIPPTGAPGSFIPDLDTDFDPGNSDLIMEVVAVELTNPFDVDIELGDSGVGNGEFYYLQLGELYFRLAQHALDVPQNAPTVVTIPAGESIVFYCTMQAPDDVLGSIKSKGGAAAATTLDAWAQAQFGPNATLMWPMGTFNAGTVDEDRQSATPLALAVGQYIDLLGQWTALDPDIVRLWYAAKPQLNLPGGPSIATPVTEDIANNDPSTDILVDRLRVPSSDPGVFADVRRTGGNQQISGATATTVGAGDDSGFTIAQWATLRRSGDPEAAEFESGTYRGAFPAWTFEPVEEASTLFNNLVVEDDQATATAGDPFDKADFTGSDYAADSLDQWFTETAAATPTSTILPGIRQPFSDRYDGATELITAIVGPRIEHRLTSDGLSTLTAARIADLLLPMGIGPMHDPGADLADLSDDRWMTLSEAITFATGLETAAGPMAMVGDADAAFAELGLLYEGVGVDVAATAAPGDAPLFLGQLRVEAYVPFVDGNGDGQYNSPILDPAAGDVPWGLRIPPAQRLLESVTFANRDEGSLVRPIFGKLNINTAPLDTLRMLPMISPPDGIDDVLAADLGGAGEMWWWDRAGPAPINASTDIASTIKAYRDRQRVVTRSPASSGGSGNGIEVDFLDPSDDLVGDGPPGYDTGDIGRGAANGVLGITERPGIRSVGELLGVNEPSFVQSMTQLLDAGVEVTVPGVASTLYDDGTGSLVAGDGVVTDPVTGAPIADYDQQLPIVNSVLNTVSVGSDYYAVWLLLHGYSEEDTLNTDVPLTPTVARRFLMIVDRSGVLQRGDEPEILLFREVPVALP